MAKIGDTVRFLNTTGGGRITRIEGKIAYVNEEGFETPVLLKDIVVVMPAGHELDHKGSKIMFDQKAFDAGKQDSHPIPDTSHNSGKEESVVQPIVETPYGDELNIALGFEPSNIKALSQSKFTAVLVNDSNYFLDFCFLRRGDGERGWTRVYGATVAPNELIDLVVLTHEDLPDYEKICLQAIAYKSDKSFLLQAPVNISKKLDLTKFHKLHCFRPGDYFENPVIEIKLVDKGLTKRDIEIDRESIENSLKGEKSRKILAEKFNNGKERKKPDNPEANPNKLLPLIEVDLHIGELVDSTAGMENKDMLDLQLDTVRKTMKAHERRKGQKIVFIHGKGEGVLRKAVLDLLKKEYPKAELQDASFREYGFGATLVTLH